MSNSPSLAPPVAVGALVAETIRASPLFRQLIALRWVNEFDSRSRPGGCALGVSVWSFLCCKNFLWLFCMVLWSVISTKIYKQTIMSSTQIWLYVSIKQTNKGFWAILEFSYSFLLSFYSIKSRHVFFICYIYLPIENVYIFNGANHHKNNICMNFSNYN